MANKGGGTPHVTSPVGYSSQYLIGRALRAAPAAAVTSSMDRKHGVTSALEHIINSMEKNSNNFIGIRIYYSPDADKWVPTKTETWSEFKKLMERFDGVISERA